MARKGQWRVQILPELKTNQMVQQKVNKLKFQVYMLAMLCSIYIIIFRRTMYNHPYYNPFFVPYMSYPWNFQSTQLTPYQAINLPQENIFQKMITIDHYPQQIVPNSAPIKENPRESLYSVSLRAKNTKSMQNQVQKVKVLYDQDKKNISSNSNLKIKYLCGQRQKNKSKNKTNSISNILRLFLRRLSTKSLSFQALVIRIIKKFNLDIQLTAFLDWVDRQQINHRIYLTTQTVKKYFEGNCDFAKIMRILFEHFIKDQSILCYLTSKKAKKESLRSNLAYLRLILKDLFD